MVFGDSVRHKSVDITASRHCIALRHCLFDIEFITRGLFESFGTRHPASALINCVTYRSSSEIFPNISPN